MKDEGTCRFCLKPYAGRGIKKHLLSCKVRANKNQEELTQGKKTSAIYHLRLQSYEPFWLHVEMKSTSMLADLDKFLRDTWLEEECGHLSKFIIGGASYVEPDLHEEWEKNWRTMGLESKPSNIQLRKVVKVKDRFKYEYDFGSTTYVEAEVVEERRGVLNEKVRILARNSIPKEACSVCENVAVMYCTKCREFYCAQCLFEHSCSDEMALPVVNSPRMGVCGYEGEYDRDDFDLQQLK